MRPRIGIRWLALAGLAAGLGVAGGAAVLGRERGRDLPPGEELRLPAEPPAGHWDDPREGARWEEGQRRIGVALSALPERGPLRCHLRAVPGAAAAGEPELEVRVTNPSDAPVTLPGPPDLIDHVTFIFRDPGGAVVSSFCYANVRSAILRDEPAPLVFGPGAGRSDTLYLSVAADHGFRPLRPGRYTIEAVFPGAGCDVLARSRRLPVVVGRP